MFANGGISDFEDVKKVLEFTKADGAMSSEAILEYPALFEPSKIYDIDDLCLEMIEVYKKYKGETDLRYLKRHLKRFLFTGYRYQNHTDLLERLDKFRVHTHDLDYLQDIVLEMKDRRTGMAPIEKLSWYYRYWD